ncbi:DMT family transporter [Ferrovibrio sp. MS7]|uniref:DMT family transporter n=1 Tax=Ferrovibrio plantarum TaxID=3119164 RepID=UPI003136BD7E
MKTISSPPLLLQMLVCSFLWASAFILMKLAGLSLSPAALAAIRGLTGGLLIGLWIVTIARLSVLPRGRDLRDWLVLGLLQGVIPNTLTVYALMRIPAGLTSMIQASTPLIVAVLAQCLFASEKITPRRLLGIGIGFSGMVLLLGPNAFSNATQQSVDMAGAAAMLIVAVSYALGNVYVRYIPSPEPIRLAFGQQLLSGLPCLGLALWQGGTAAFTPALESWPLLLLLGVFGTALPIVLYMHILHKAGPTIGSMNGYFLPPWTIILGFLLLGEAISPREVIATAIVLTGVAIVSRRPAG